MTEKQHEAAEKAKEHEAKSAEAKKAEAKPKAEDTGPRTAKKKPSYKIVRSVEAVRAALEKQRLEKKKGKFKRPCYGKWDKVKNRWRRPKGVDSRQRQGFKCKPPMPNAGNMTSPEVKGLHYSGYLPVRIFNVAGLESIDHKKEAIIIAATVSKRKRVEIQKAAVEKKIQVLNYKE